MRGRRTRALIRARALCATGLCLQLYAAIARAQSIDSTHAHLALAILYDITAYSQDHTSVEQVGDLAAVGRVRTDRAMLDGAFTTPVKWKYLIAVDYNGVRNKSRPAFTINDFSLTFPLGKGVDLGLGRQKEGVTSEVTASTRTLVFTERPASLTSIFPARSDGVRLIGGDVRTGRWSVGWFNRAKLESGPTPAGGNDYAGRIFFARFGDGNKDSATVLHVGASAAWNGAVNDSLRFRARPEDNEAPYFIDTKNFPSDGAATFGLEGIAQRHSVSFISELLVTHADVVPAPSSTFVGWYGEVSWRPLGEPRTYDPAVGTLSRVKQRKHHDAFEIGARFSHSDFSSGSLDGGVFDRASLAASWFSRWSTRVDLGYGFGILTRDAATGHTHFIITRLQWELL